MVKEKVQENMELTGTYNKVFGIFYDHGLGLDYFFLVAVLFPHLLTLLLVELELQEFPNATLLYNDYFNYFLINQ